MDRSPKEEPRAFPARRDAAPDSCQCPDLPGGSRQPQQGRYLGATSILFLALWLALLAGGSKMLRDPGTLWHTVVGERILQTGECVRTDPFTFTQHGQKWLAQQWLGECAMAIIHRLGGLDGLVLATATLLAGLFTWLATRATRNGLPWPVAVLLILLVIAASSYHFIPRPHLITMLLIAGGLALLTDIESGRLDPRWLLVIPPTMVLWTNIHGGALGGLATLYIVLMGWLLRPASTHADSGLPFGGLMGRLIYFASKRPDSGLPVGGPHSLSHASSAPASPQLIAVTLGLSTAAILINPYGPSLPTVWLALMGSELLPRFIIEHAPLNPLSTEGLMIIVLAAVYLSMLASARRRGLRICWLVPLVWLVLAFTRIRHGPLFAVAAAIAIADMLPYVRWPGLLAKAVDGQRPLDAPRPPPALASRWRPAAIPAALVLCATILQVTGAPVPIVGANRSRPDPAYWPVEATEALRRYMAEHPTERHVFNDMRFGGYLMYHLPQARIYIDDRCELYADPGLRRYVELRKHPDRMAGVADYENVHLALVQTRSPLVRYFTDSPGWTQLHQDRTASLYRRNARPAPPAAPGKAGG